MGTLWLSYEIPKPGFARSIFRARIVGDRGSLDLDGFGKLRLGEADAWNVVHEQEPIDAVGRMFEWSRMECFVLLVQDFVDALSAGREPTVTAWDGLAAVAMVEASYESSRRGTAIDLDLTSAVV
jgi:predicted dehydrogenase